MWLGPRGSEPVSATLDLTAPKGPLFGGPGAIHHQRPGLSALPGASPRAAPFRPGRYVSSRPLCHEPPTAGLRKVVRILMPKGTSEIIRCQWDFQQTLTPQGLDEAGTSC